MLAAVAESVAVIEHPNRLTVRSRTTRAAVVAMMLVSAALLTIVTVGGLSKIQGAKPMQIGYVVVYLLIAFFVARWRSGLLPLAAALAIVLLMFAAISGPQWFARDRPGLSDPALDAGILGVLTLVLVPVQALLIVFAAQGFAQRWSVQVQRGTAEARAA
jgi:hypothetical protein